MVLSLQLLEIQNEQLNDNDEGGSMAPNESCQGSLVDGSEENSDPSELPSPVFGSPSTSVRPESPVLGYEESPETVPEEWSLITETIRRDLSQPKLDGETDSILDHLRSRQEASTTPPAIHEYTIAWVCALPIELAAAVAVLDFEYPESPPIPAADENVYIFGRVGDHNIILGCPSDIYGTTSCAVVAAQMYVTFTALRFVLMVGIGGGVPNSSNDIRLGDVVVATLCRDSKHKKILIMQL
ncbi:hypothetical protein ABW20_dc0106485 [Dactylellina cionopaga]|nr:hypothetical protein ABW20_dc0106485 [Dactylellina cionopaga]